MPRTQPISPRFRRIYEHLSGAELAVSEEQDLSLEDLGLDADQDARVDLVFGTYSHQGLRKALDAYGLLQRVEERVGEPLEMRIQCEDPFRPRFVLWNRCLHAPVADVALRRASGAEVGLTGELATAPLLYLDSLLLQDPGRPFDWSRPPLPGQQHPGLNIAGQVLDLLLLMARRIGAEGMALVPATFAAACVYERRFLFVDGDAQARFLSLREAGRQYPRWLLAWAVELGCFRDTEGQPALYLPTPMLSPLSRRLAQHLDSALGDEAPRALLLDEERLQQRFPWHLMPLGPPPERVAELLAYDPLAPVMAH